MENLRVIKDTYNGNLYVIDDNDVKTMNLCDTYDNYGNVIGHYAAGDYHIGNSGCDYEKDLKSYLTEKFGIDFSEVEFEADEEVTDIYADEDNLSDFIANNKKKILSAVEDFRKENEHITECKSLEYWDGNNHQSIVLEDENGCDYRFVYADVNTEEYVLEDYKKAEWTDYERGFSCSKGNNSYNFRKSCYQKDAFFVAEVVNSEDYL